MLTSFETHKPFGLFLVWLINFRILRIATTCRVDKLLRDARLSLRYIYLHNYFSDEEFTFLYYVCKLPDY